MLRWVLLLAFLIVGWSPSQAEAACNTAGAPILVAASAGRADVGDCYIAASALGGDTIQIPSGMATWSTSLTVMKNVSFVGATCTLDGNGRPTSCGTSITSGVNGAMLLIESQAAWVGFRIQNIEFKSNDECTSVHIYGDDDDFRTDHNRFVYTDGDGECNHAATLTISEYARGVVDHNYFQTNAYVGFLSRVSHGAWENMDGSEGQQVGDYSWSVPSTTGTIDLVVYESNTWHNTNNTNPGGCSAGGPVWVTDHDLGARVVHRFDIWINAIPAVHGTEYTRNRGPFHLEFYLNVFTMNGNSVCPDIYGQRGGTGMFWGNAATTSGGDSFIGKIATWTSYRAHDYTHTYYAFGHCRLESVTITYSGTTAVVEEPGHANDRAYLRVTGSSVPALNTSGVETANVDGDHYSYQFAGGIGSGSATATVSSPFDGNTGDPGGYRCMDQFGAGHGAYITGYGPGNMAITPLANLNQILEPHYSWHNTLNGSESLPANDTGGVAQENRDFYISDADCVAGGACPEGVGWGNTLPTSCTPGVGFFKENEGEWNSANGATADGRFYICTDANTWEPSYGQNTPGTDREGLPLCFPHPLVSGEACEDEGEPPPPAASGTRPRSRARVR